MSTENRARSLERLCALYNLPFELAWKADISPEAYTPYRYWRQLGILSPEEYEAVLKAGRVTPNANMDTYFRTVDEHFPPALYHDGAVADVGSGFGFTTMWLVLKGARLVHTIGDPGRVGFIQRLYAAAVERGLLPPDRIVFAPAFVRTGDTALASGIAPGSLDLVLLTDTLEHITPRILPSLALAAYNGLKPGGWFISKQQNSDSPSMLLRLRSIWERVEREEAVPQRARLIREWIPDIKDDVANELARCTRGLDKPDFEAAVERFRTEGIMPAYRGDLPTIDVELDVPCEGDTGIDRVTSVFKAAGFRHVGVYPELMHRRASRWLQPLARRMPGLFFSARLFDQTSVFAMRK